MNFSEIITSKNNNKPVSLKATISGKSDNSYSVPSEIGLACNKEDCKKSVCPLQEKLSVGPIDMLKFVDVNDRFFKNTIISAFHLPCSHFNYTVEKFQSLLRIFITAEDQKTFTCFFSGIDIEINQTYELTGIVVSDPRTQNTTAIFTSAKKISSAIESFSITKELHNKLNEFSVSSPTVESIMVHLEKLYSSYASNITHIYDRYDLHLAIDLAFRSPLEFKFDGEYFHKGCSDIAVIGDTRVGKGFVAEGLQKFFGVGEVVSGDNATLTGLIGGLKSIERNWTVQWGKFPKNDRGLLILDETSKLSRYTLSHLTRIRSEGIAEIHKVQSYSSPARVRTIFILNPGNGKNISHYPYGIQSILSVFKDPATVSRFDYVLVVSKDEADSSAVNSARKSVPEMFPQDLERQLIHWTWSRKNGQIIFSDRAIERCYMLALDLAETYSFDVPLVQSENIRYKLAKISACFAARVYSAKYTGKNLFIDSVHVECAWFFLTMIYKKRASSYYAMSMIQKNLNAQNEKIGLVAIQRYFESFYSKRLKLLEVLLSNQTITMNDISDQADISKDVALEVITKLVKNRLIERSGFTYIKTPLFTEWLRDNISISIGA